MVSRGAIQGRVDGLEEARRALERVIRAEQASIPGALELIGQQLTTEVRRRAPKKTGTLRRSYGWSTGSDGSSAWVEVSSNVFYAPYQEFGTSRMNGTPHLRPAVEAMRPQIPAIIAEAAGRAGMSQSFGSKLAGGFGALASRITAAASGGGQ